jgi:hypothetical protein
MLGQCRHTAHMRPGQRGYSRSWQAGAVTGQDQIRQRVSSCVFFPSTLGVSSLCFTDLLLLYLRLYIRLFFFYINSFCYTSRYSMSVYMHDKYNISWRAKLSYNLEHREISFFPFVCNSKRMRHPGKAKYLEHGEYLFFVLSATLYGCDN